MTNPNIEGVYSQPLKIISDERGAVLRMFHNENLLFKNFGEIYLSEINPGAVKAWKRNKKHYQKRLMVAYL